MKLRTKLNKGKYDINLLDVPLRLKFESLVRLEENKDKTIEELHKMVTESKELHKRVVKYNEEQRNKTVKTFKEDMVKEVMNELKLDEVKAKKVANKIYNNNQGKSYEYLVDKLEEHISYLQGILE